MDIGEFFSDTLSNAMIYSSLPLVQILVVIYLGIVFMISRITRSPNWDATFRQELYEAIISFVYVIFLLLILPLFDLFFDLNAVLAYFKPVIVVGLNVIIKLITISYSFSVLNSLSLYPSASYDLGVFQIGSDVSFNPITSLMGIMMSFTMSAIPILLASLMSIVGQIFVFSFLKGVLPVFLALGILLRSIVFTRKIGNTILGVFLGVYFFMGVAFIAEGQVFENVIYVASSNSDYYPESPESISSSYMGITNSNFFGSGSDYTSETFEKNLEISEGGSEFMLSAIFGLFDLNIFTYIPEFCATEKGNFCGGGLFSSVCKSTWKIMCPIYGFGDWFIKIVSFFPKIIGGLGLLMASELLYYTAIPTNLIDSFSSVIANDIAVLSPVLVISFFAPVLNLLFVMAGTRSVVEALGGDVSIVDMFMFV